MAGYIGNQAQIRSGLSATIDELNIIDGVTATTAELNILDGVTSTATELNILDGVTATTAELNIIDGVTATTAELNILDGVTSTTAELNIMDGVTATAAEINLIDGGTARGTTAVADGDGFLTNDGGTMRMTKVDTLATYMGTKIIGGSLVYIASSGAISNAASVAFTQFDASKYDHYKFYFQYVKPATDGVRMYGHASTNGGSSYDSTNGNYHMNYDTDSTGFTVNQGDPAGNGTNEYGISGDFFLANPALATYTYSSSGGILNTSQTDGHIWGQGHQPKYAAMYLNTAVVNAIQFKFDSGNITSGEIVMYGIANGT